MSQSKSSEVSRESLRRMYVDERKAQHEIANELGCHQSTVSRNLEKFGISRPWKDADLLDELYHGEGLNTYEIADRLGCDQSTISNQMEENGIERRNQGSQFHYTRLYVSDSGHVKWRGSESGEKVTVAVHQLLAIANGENPHKVFADGDFHCHHRDWIPWTNIPENIQLVTRKEHTRIHNNGSYETTYLESDGE